MAFQKHSATILAIILVLIALTPTLEIQDNRACNDSPTLHRPVEKVAQTEETVLNTWHHDCTNLTDFQGEGDESWLVFDNRDNSFGELDSQGGYVEAVDTGTGSVWHGPMLYHEFADSFSLSDFVKLSAEVEIVSTEPPSKLGHVVVGLHDELNNSILQLQLSDARGGEMVAYSNAAYVFSNGTPTETPAEEYVSLPFHETNTLISNSSGIYAVLPRGTNRLLISADDMESTRQIKFVSIGIRSYQSDTLCDEVRLHDILLEYNTTQPVADTYPPSIDHPADLEFAEIDGVKQITWTPDDEYPDSYVLYRDSVEQDSGSWDGNSITVDIYPTQISLGMHNYTISVSDTSGNAASDTVMVTILDETNPVIDGPSDMEIRENETGNIVTWLISENHPHRYEILRNDILVKSGFLSSSDDSISYEIVGLTVGTWNLTLILYDTSGNTAIDSMIVSVLPGTSSGGQQPNSSMIITAITSIAGFLGVTFLGYMYVLRRRSKEEKIHESVEIEEDVRDSIESDEIIQALRGGEFIGNRFRFKVKVLNKSPLVITDITIGIISYPKDSLNLEGNTIRTLSKLDPEGFRSPTFDFLPTQDCVKGNIVANVTYIDSRGNAHSVTAKPYTIRAVCDLLSPEEISPEDFMLKLGTLGHGEMTVKVNDWTPEEMHDKTVTILKTSNFFEVDSELNRYDEHVESKIRGWAKGIYTDQNMGIVVTISGKSGRKGATCRVEMSGEDEAMIMPAMDEITQKLGAWLCPKCGGSLHLEQVDELKAGRSVCCPFCGVTMDR